MNHMALVGMLLAMFAAVMGFITLRKRRGGTSSRVELTGMIFVLAAWAVIAIILLVRHFG